MIMAKFNVAIIAITIRNINMKIMENVLRNVQMNIFMMKMIMRINVNVG